MFQGEEVVLVQGQAREASGEGWLGQADTPSMAKYSCVLCWTPREKVSVEEEIKEKEEAIRQRSSEVQVRSSIILTRSIYLDEMCPPVVNNRPWWFEL